jgi:hypothetical protein
MVTGAKCQAAGVVGSKQEERGNGEWVKGNQWAVISVQWAGNSVADLGRYPAYHERGSANGAATDSTREISITDN